MCDNFIYRFVYTHAYGHIFKELFLILQLAGGALVRNAEQYALALNEFIDFGHENHTFEQSQRVQLWH